MERLQGELGELSLDEGVTRSLTITQGLAPDNSP